ncbi:hypothetical protein WOLCODRAFT_27681 [Wolfiporia cocos MD-104 SS10]|uniref:Uncharacterized protein n=1 Tax=Wolfiporia cocos (strain MD-104) TaxID=742152 RepID=A0A2H3IYT0_WOLCO|nr:hypothetical protein WOLCODRAFT_27681 [Wolfiporia cocos MD-104 SS10]
MCRAHTGALTQRCPDADYVRNAAAARARQCTRGSVADVTAFGPQPSPRTQTVSEKARSQSSVYVLGRRRLQRRAL